MIAAWRVPFRILSVVYDADMCPDPLGFLLTQFPVLHFQQPVPTTLLLKECPQTTGTHLTCIQQRAGSAWKFVPHGGWPLASDWWGWESKARAPLPWVGTTLRPHVLSGGPLWDHAKALLCGTLCGMAPVVGSFPNGSRLSLPHGIHTLWSLHS